MHLLQKYTALTACLFVLQACTSGGTTTQPTTELPLNTGSAKSVALQGGQYGYTGDFADYDGDGIDDMIVGAPYARGEGTVGAVLVHRGSTTGFDANPTWVITGDDNFGYRVKTIGDADGDGIADFAVSAYNGNGSDVSLSGSVTVFKGGSSGKTIAKLAGQDALDKFGLGIAAGDFNGDGKPDLVVGAPFNSPTPALYQKGAVYIYPHPYSDATRITLAASAANGGLGNSVTTGDVNGDGIDDLLIGTSSKLLVYYGGKNSFSPRIDTPDVTISGAATDTSFGAACAVIGDLDGDGIREIVVGAPKATITGAAGGSAEVGRIYIVKGGTGKRTINLSNNPNLNLITRIDGTGFFERFGFAITPVGALPGDGGKPNFAVSAPLADKTGATSIRTGLTSGKVYLFQGRRIALGGGTTPISAGTVFESPEYNMHYGHFLVPLSKDGSKMLIGAPTVNRQTGGTYVVSLQNGEGIAPASQAPQTATGDSTIPVDCHVQ